jgi:hypothetical protein
MVTYPIHIARNGYRGTDPRRRRKADEDNRIAAELERRINERLKAQKAPTEIYTYNEIARETGYPVEVVSRLCYSIDCGGNGFTGVKREPGVGRW